MRFENKVALVTGGSRGIGHAIASRLQSEGAKIFSAQRGKAKDFITIEADFTQPESATKIISEVISQGGCLDILINNAGMMQESSIENMSLADWQKNLTVNLTLPFLLIQACLPHLKKTQGNIVNIGSIEGVAANPNHAAYCATKAGLHGLTRAVAIDHGNEGINCNAVAPGWIDTDLNLDFINAMPDPEKFTKEIAKIHPVGRTGKIEEVAALVAFLASDESDFINGQTYIIDGGRTAKLSLPNG